MSKDNKYNQEDMVWTSPDDDISCKDCRYANDDVYFGEQLVMNGYKGGVCKKYPKEKPYDILWKGKQCPYKQT